MFYVYIHRDPRTNEIRYVGKGHNDRAWNFANRSAHHKRWIESLKKIDLCPIVELLSSHDVEQDAFAQEIYWIDYYRNHNVSLCNLTNGGEGVSGHKHSEDIKNKMRHPKKRAGWLGLKHSKETKKKMSDGHRAKRLKTKKSEDNSISPFRRNKNKRPAKKYNTGPNQVIDVSAGFVWDSAQEAARVYGIPYSSLKIQLDSYAQNRTSLCYIKTIS